MNAEYAGFGAPFTMAGGTNAAQAPTDVAQPRAFSKLA
jgi:hypothetical protein